MSQLISWAATRNADRTAFIYDDRVSTFAEVERRSTRLAHGLGRIGISKGDHVAVLIGNRPEYAECEFAIAKAGAVRVPLLIQSTPAELRRCLVAAECRAVVVSSEAADNLRSALSGSDPHVRVVAIDCRAEGEFDFEALIDEAPDVPLVVAIAAEDRYAIRFTGGTTGTPKGVVMSHRNMVAIVVNTVLNWPLDRSDVGLHIHPLSHAAGMMMYAYWFLGATNVIRPAFRFSPEDFVSSVARHRVTSVFMIPTVLGVLLDSPAVRAADLSSIRTIVYGGGPIPAARLEEGLERFGPVFLQVYGTSEAPFALTTLHREEHRFVDDAPPRHLRSAGRQIFNAQVKIIDEGGGDVPPGAVGEVAALCDTNMVGYWKNPELTARRLVDGWVRTGDMGYLDGEGYLYIVDRKDDLIITGGFNVWPTEVEDVLCRHPGVREAAVFGVQDAKWGDAVTAVVTPKEGSRLSEAELIAFLGEHLAKYKIPKRIAIRDGELPKSAVGKLLRRRVRDELLNGNPLDRA